uniref:Prolyl 4-hydroxylase alpha subunit Fe(2+) 2OG dioxygenase domain-containing protein n=1 Tax=Corethron hystrix TaxID=216773 RepID=A0A7S1C241_9STRA
MQSTFAILPIPKWHSQACWKNNHNRMGCLQQRHQEHISSCSCTSANQNNVHLRTGRNRAHQLADTRLKLAYSSRDYEVIEKSNENKNEQVMSSSSSVCCNDIKIDDDENVEALSSFYSAIKKGEIFIRPDFLNPSEVSLLRNDILQLQNLSASSIDKSRGCYFKPSGLSNRFPGDENYFGSSDRLTCTITPDLKKGNEKYANMRSILEQKMELVRHELEQALSLSTKGANKNDDELELKLEEMYYSISPTGSHLPRHNDERHEDTKGEKGWINETRRSISWLIYLNYDDDNANDNIDHHPWKSFNGGQLRAYCRKSRGSGDNSHVPCGSHQENIQVGWLKQPQCVTKKESSKIVSQQIMNDNNKSTIEFEPVFLDSWIQTPMTLPKNLNQKEIKDENYTDDHDKDNAKSSFNWIPMSALYRINNKRTYNTTVVKEGGDNGELGGMNNKSSDRDYLSKPFGPQSPLWPSDKNLEPTDFARALASQLSTSDHRKRFIGLEDIHIMDDPSMINIVDIVPIGGTLVMFDSVTVPHEVLEVHAGVRLAIAGWFHEKQQEFPDWYGT